MDRRKHVKSPVSVPREHTVKKPLAKTASSPKFILWPGILAALTAFLVYAQTLGYGFVLDDYSVILENNSTRLGIGELGLFFKTSLRHGYILLSDELYRPLTKSVYALQWSLAPENPFPGHLMNILLFSLTCWLIYRFVSLWTNSEMTGFITAAIFAVMPVHTEAVANIKSVDEILAFLFGLLSLHSFYKHAITAQTSKLVIALSWFLLALFSKESSITLLAVIPLLVYFFTDARGGKIWTPFAAAAVLAFIFLGIRQGVLGANASSSVSAADNMLMISKDTLVQKMTAVYLLGRYLWVTVTGFPLSFDHSWPSLPLMSAGDWQFILSALVLTALLVFAILTFKKREPLSFAILFFFITVAVSSNIFMIIGTHWGERLMYMPSFGICLALAVLISRYTHQEGGFAKQTLALGITGILVLVFGGMTIARNPVWKDNLTLYTSGLTSAPNSARVNYYMGNYLGKEENYKGLPEAEKSKVLDEAIRYLEKSLQLYPPFADAWNQKGLCYYRKKEYKLAAESYIKGIEINPTDPTIHNNIGTIYFATGRYQEATTAFEQAVKLKPDYKDAWSNLGSVYGTTKRYQESINAFNRAVEIDPQYAQAWYYLGLTWRFAGDEQKAQMYIAKAKQINPELK